MPFASSDAADTVCLSLADAEADVFSLIAHYR